MYTLAITRRVELVALAQLIEFGAPVYKEGGGWPSTDPEWATINAEVEYSPTDLSTLTDEERRFLANHIACSNYEFPSLELKDGKWMFHSLSV
jgi:hypothetical protein